MSQVSELHEQAMSSLDSALIARRRGDIELARNFSLQALDFETSAAELLRNEYHIEPGRSILYRSAAAVAIQCGRYREAERLIATALSGDPPKEIA